MASPFPGVGVSAAASAAAGARRTSAWYSLLAYCLIAIGCWLFRGTHGGLSPPWPLPPGCPGNDRTTTGREWHDFGAGVCMGRTRTYWAHRNAHKNEKMHSECAPVLVVPHRRAFVCQATCTYWGGTPPGTRCCCNTERKSAAVWREIRCRISVHQDNTAVQETTTNIPKSRRGAQRAIGVQQQWCAHASTMR